MRGAIKSVLAASAADDAGMVLLGWRGMYWVTLSEHRQLTPKKDFCSVARSCGALTGFDELVVGSLRNGMDNLLRRRVLWTPTSGERWRWRKLGLPELGEVVPGVLHLSRLAVFTDRRPCESIGWAVVPIASALSAATVDLSAAAQLVRGCARLPGTVAFTLEGTPKVEAFLVQEAKLSQRVIDGMIGPSVRS